MVHNATQTNNVTNRLSDWLTEYDKATVQIYEKSFLIVRRYDHTNYKPL